MNFSHESPRVIFANSTSELDLLASTAYATLVVLVVRLTGGASEEQSSPLIERNAL